MIYVFGGSDAVFGGESQNTVIFTRANPNGALGTWRTSPEFGQGLSTPVAVATPGHLHIVGGLTSDDVPSNAVWTNQLQPDGSLSNWTPAPMLPVGLWYHQAGVVAGRVYVWGGLEKSGGDIVPVTTVYSAPILGNGKLGDWAQERRSLEQGFYSSSTSVAGNYLMSFSPRYEGGVLSNDAWWTSITPAGMDRWQKFPTQIPHRVYHAATADYFRNAIYISGGRATKETDLLTDIAYFQLAPQVQQAAEVAWTAATSATAQTATVSVQQATQAAPASTPEPAKPNFGQTSPQVDGFQPIALAQFRAGSERLPMVMLFTLPSSNPGREQMELLNRDSLKAFAAKVSLALIDVSADRQTAQNRGVFRVPTWIFFNRKGEEVNRVAGKMTPAEIEAAINSLN